MSTHHSALEKSHIVSEVFRGGLERMGACPKDMIYRSAPGVPFEVGAGHPAGVGKGRTWELPGTAAQVPQDVTLPTREDRLLFRSRCLGCLVPGRREGANL